MTGRKRRILTIALGALGLGTHLFADPDRCQDCGFCSSSDFACGLCIVEAVQTCCPEYSSEAYALCDGGSWKAYCDGPTGGFINC